MRKSKEKAKVKKPNKSKSIFSCLCCCARPQNDDQDDIQDPKGSRYKQQQQSKLKSSNTKDKDRAKSSIQPSLQHRPAPIPQQFQPPQQQSKLNLKSPLQEVQQQSQNDDPEDIIPQQYNKNRKIKHIQLKFKLPSFEQYPVMQMYEHHVVDFETEELRA